MATPFHVYFQYLFPPIRCWSPTLLPQCNVDLWDISFLFNEWKIWLVVRLSAIRPSRCCRVCRLTFTHRRRLSSVRGRTKLSSQAAWMCLLSLSGWLCVGVVSSNHQSTHLLSPAQQPAVQLAWLSIWLLCHHCLSYTSGSTRVFAPFDFIPCANLYSLCASGSSALQSASQPFPPCHLLCLSPALPFISVVCSQYSLVISLHQLQSVFPVDYSALSFTCVLTMVRQFSSYA